MSRVFVTADTHFNHTNICGPSISKWDSGYRHFNSLAEMNATIINNINAVVGVDDVLWHLGDFAFGNKAEIPNLRRRINCGTIHLILGNHDHVLDCDDKKYRQEYADCFENIVRYKEMRVAGGKLVTLFHYPIGSWNEIGRGAIQLHGHCHDSYARTIGKQRDVGVDASDFKPLLLDTVVSDMEKVAVEFTDHHTKETNYH
mgnify:CR=1 FL=1